MRIRRQGSLERLAIKEETVGLIRGHIGQHRVKLNQDALHLPPLSAELAGGRFGIRIDRIAIADGAGLGRMEDVEEGLFCLGGAFGRGRARLWRLCAGGSGNEGKQGGGENGANAHSGSILDQSGTTDNRDWK